MATKRQRGLRLWCIRLLRRLIILLGCAPPSRAGTARRPETVFMMMEDTMMRERLYRQYALTIGQFARAVGVNRTYITRALAYHRLDFARYVNTYRLQHAISLMQHDAMTRLSSEEIALESGFLNERRMGYCLRQTYGVTIAVYRKRVMLLDQAKNFSTALSASGNAKTATRS